MSRPPLTWLYVPGDRPERVGKALASPADVVVLDLEDAVLAEAKGTARELVRRLAPDAARGGRRLQVRVNASSTPWAAEDLAMVAGLPGTVGVRLPKCESPDDVRDVARQVGDRPLHLLVESALGLERAWDLATAHPGVASVGLGEADLRADLGVPGEDGLAWARGRLVSASVAAGLGPPALSVFTDVRDLEGLAASCARGRALGFLGRATIHPVQLPVVRRAFLPSSAELARAQEVVAAADAAGQQGRGAVALPDGRFVDEAVVRQARRVLALGAGPGDEADEVGKAHDGAGAV